jgi:tetratricopeptide (TPR) repeat protein
MVSDRYSSSSVYGDALYGLGWVLQEEQRYDEAMAEYQKIFSANLNEGLLDPESSEDFPNYKFKAALGISECFEAKKDLPNALKYALQARDRFVFNSYCKDCILRTRASVAERVARLEKAVKKTE